MNLGGSGGGTVFFVLTLLSALASLVKCYSYYELIPEVEFVIDRQVYRTIRGDYVSYGTNTDFSKLLNVIDDPFFGCAAEANDTNVPLYPTQSAFLIPDSSHCTITEKSSFLSSTYRARAVILYRLSDSNDEDRQRRQTAQRTSGQTSSRGPTVIRLNLLTEQLRHLLIRQSASSTIQVNVEAQLIQRGFKTTQTFYFVVFAFCILMLLSCSWLLLSYFKRCHYRWRLRRNQARSANETRQMVNRLPTKSYKISKEKGEVPTCVVCLEVFKNHESIRILPCKHEFHKKCIDPWLKMKRTCPMCKQDIFPSKRRRSLDATSQRNTVRDSSQDTTAVLVTTAASSRSLRRSRSWSDSSNGSGSSNSSVASSNTSSNTSATPLLGTNDSRSYGDSEVQVIVVSPAVDSSVQETEEGIRDDSTAVEIDVSSAQQDQEPERPRGEREGESSGQNGHISVDVEGLGLRPPAPVVNA